MLVQNLLIKPVSGRCNLHCRYCFYRDEMENRGQGDYGVMPPETLEAVLKKALAAAEGSCSIAFQGGEPTLAGLDFFERAVELQEKHNVGGVKIRNAIQTNGICIDESWARFLAQHQFLVGLSLDGLRRTHDANRLTYDCQGTFYRVLEAAAVLEKAGADFNILTVVNKQTAAQIYRIYAFYKRQGYRYLQFIPCLDPIGHTPGETDWSLTPGDYGAFLCTLFDLWFEDFRRGEQPYIRQFENYVAILCGYLPEACDMRGRCSNQFVVEADGSVYPCDFYALDGYRLGSFLDNTAEELERAAEAFIEASRPRPPGCADCRYYPLCRGGCRRHRLPGGNYFCAGLRQFFDHAAERLAWIAGTLRRGGPGHGAGAGA